MVAIENNDADARMPLIRYERRRILRKRFMSALKILGLLRDARGSGIDALVQGGRIKNKREKRRCAGDDGDENDR